MQSMQYAPTVLYTFMQSGQHYEKENIFGISIH